MVLLVVDIVDVLSTTVSVQGGSGRMSRWFVGRLWSMWRRFNNLSLISRGGAVILIALFGLWSALNIVGWWLIVRVFHPDAPETDVIYSVTSLMIGRGQPAVEISPLATTLIGLSGVTLTSIALAYVIAVVGAVAFLRHVASTLATLGSSPQDVYDRNFTSEGYRNDFDLHLVSLAPNLVHAATKFLAFPVVRAFQPKTRHHSLPVMLTSVHHGLALAARDGHRLPTAVEAPWLRAVDQLLTVYGFDADDEDEFHCVSDVLKGFEQREERLLAWVDYAGWSKDDVYQ
ncbi:MAG: hypothetical protein AAGA56_02165 [Myxococcota bacterium]